MRPVVFYCLASAGMGHATRAVPVLNHLSKRFDVHVFCGGPAHRWLGAKFPNVHRVHRVLPVFRGERVSLPLVYARVGLTFPLSIASIAAVARHIVRLRPRVLITDFEAHGTYAALLTRGITRTRVIEFDNFVAMRSDALPFTLSADEERSRVAWARSTRAVVPRADHVVVQSLLGAPPPGSDEIRVPPPIREELANYRGPISSEGRVVVSLGGRSARHLERVFERSSLSFDVFGWAEERSTTNVRYRRFAEADYFDALAKAPFAIVSANSSALDAIALKKPVLVHPIPGQFEQRFSARLLEHVGVGQHVETLDEDSIVLFSRRAGALRARVAEKTFFDNARVFATLDRLIDQP